MNENGIKTDTAHLNESSFYDVAKLSYIGPVLCSHTAFYGVHKHPRNLKDAQIKRITDSNGLAGLCLAGDFLTSEKSASVSDAVRHIDYFAGKFGVNCLAIGTDFYGADNFPRGLENYGGFGRLAEKLSRLGYSEFIINRIFYENARNFFTRCNTPKASAPPKSAVIN